MGDHLYYNMAALAEKSRIHAIFDEYLYKYKSFPLCIPVEAGIMKAYRIAEEKMP